MLYNTRMVEESQKEPGLGIPDAEDITVEAITGVSEADEAKLAEYRAGLEKRFAFVHPDGTPMTTEQKLKVIADEENAAVIAQQKIDSKKAAGANVSSVQSAQASIQKARAAKARSDFAKGSDIKV